MRAPPRLALWLLGRLLPRSDRETLIGDLLEAWQRRSPPPPRRWFWRQAFAALTIHRPRKPELHLPMKTRRRRWASPLADLRFTLRQLRRAPAHSAVVVFTLAIGVGATTAVFSVANPVLFRPLPYPEPDRLAMIWEIDAERLISNVGYATFADLERDSKELESVAAMAYWSPVVGGSESPERLRGQSVTSRFFQTLGVVPGLGRDFLPDDDRPGSNRVVILSDGLWRRRFGADPTIVSRTIDLSGYPYTVVGVLPPNFESLLAPEAQLWRPLGYDISASYACRTCRHLRAVGRAHGPAEAPALRLELEQLFRRYAAENPGEYASTALHPVALETHVTERVRPALLLALAAGVVVLLIAAVNVANLTLARAVERERELAVRATLGAGLGRLVRQILTEGWLLALAGAVGGVGLAFVGIELLLAGNDLQIPRLDVVGIDWQVLVVALGLTVPITVLAGLGPAWFAARRGGEGLLRRASASAWARRRATGGLVVLEIALAVMLLTGAGLLLRSLREVLALEPGFRTSQLLTLEVTATGPRYDDETIWRTTDQVIAAVGALPEVVSVGVSSQIPLGGNLDMNGVQIEDQPLDNPEDAPSADRYAVSAGYTSTMAVPILRGRGLSSDDRRDRPAVVLVNQSFASFAWPDADPLGKRIRMGSGGWRTIVGVTGDVRHGGLEAEQTFQFYLPFDQWPWAEATYVLVARTAADPASALTAVRQRIAEIDPGLAISAIATGDALVVAATAQRRLLLRLFEAFALAALGLAAAGVYGLLARSVAERTRELGIRVALGAGRSAVVRSVLGHGARMAALGLLLGLMGAAGTARLIQGLLYQVAPSDPLTFVLVAVVLGMVALATTIVPAWRAARVDPVDALRAE